MRFLPMKVRLIMERASQNSIVLKQHKTKQKTQQQKNLSLVIMFVATATRTGK